MTDSINDSSAQKVPTGFLDDANAALIDDILQTMTFTLEGTKYPGAQLLYPFYGGHKKPGTPILVPYGGFTSTEPAGTVHMGETAVVIVNKTADALTVTRPYRDGGWMTAIPQDEDGTLNCISAHRTLNGTGYMGVGGYLNGIQWVLYGSGAVLKLTPSDTGKQPALIGYSASVNGGWSIGLKADASKVSDCEHWFKKEVDNLNFHKTVSLGDPYGDLTLNVCVGSQKLDGNVYGAVMLVQVS